MKLLVTGGAGFIGSNFVRHILNKYPDYEVINLDKLTYAGNLENLKDVEGNPRYKFIQGDICDLNLVLKILQEYEVDAIVNFAAQTHVDKTIQFKDIRKVESSGVEELFKKSKNDDFVLNNIWGTHILLEAAVKAIEMGKNIKYLQVSTDEVYGSIEDGQFKEEDNLKPNSPYSASKAGGDLMVLAYHKTFGLPVLITRGSNTFGPYQYPEKLIPLFVTNLLENKKVPVYGDGLNVRDWIYVLDHCAGIDFVLHEGEIGEAYNIGGGNEKTNLEITSQILSQLGFDEAQIEYVKDRPGHDRRYALDTEKVRTLGWAPEYDFDEAMKQTIDWYRENAKWWQPIKSGEFLEWYKKQYEK